MEPNMGGKRYYIRYVALIGVIASVGSFVSATTAKLHVLDAISTPMGAFDNIRQASKIKAHFWKCLLRSLAYSAIAQHVPG
ncbi:hypothetical protein vseg_007442 [Gypsophila vaccaria]